MISKRKKQGCTEIVNLRENFSMRKPLLHYAYFQVHYFIHTSSAFGTVTFKNLQYMTHRRNGKEQKQHKRPPFEVYGR